MILYVCICVICTHTKILTQIRGINVQALHVFVCLYVIENGLQEKIRGNIFTSSFQRGAKGAAVCLDFTGLDTSLELAVFASASTVILPVVPSAVLWRRKRRAGELLETCGVPLPPARLSVTHLSLVLPWERLVQNFPNAPSKILL